MRAQTLLVVVIAIALAASAQQVPGSKTVAVSVYSTDERVSRDSHELAVQAKKVAEQFKNVTGMIVDGNTSEAAETARKKGADYLVSIEVSPRSTAGVKIGRGVPNDFPTPERAKAEGLIHVKYTVLNLNSSFKASDDWTLKQERYPAGPEWNWLKALTSRAVKDATDAGMKKLQNKKQL